VEAVEAFRTDHRVRGVVVDRSSAVTALGEVVDHAGQVKVVDDFPEGEKAVVVQVGAVVVAAADRDRFEAELGGALDFLDRVLDVVPGEGDLADEAVRIAALGIGGGVVIEDGEGLAQPQRLGGRAQR
jgi:hypothetical protein